MCTVLDVAQCALYILWMASFRDQLRAALRSKGWTHAELIAASGVECALSSMSRKLSGHQGIEAKDARRLAAALGITQPELCELTKIERRLGTTISLQPEKQRGAA